MEKRQQRRNRKKVYERVAPLNLTFTPTIMKALNDLVKAGGYKGPVEYFSAHIRRRAGLEDEQKLAA